MTDRRPVTIRTATSLPSFAHFCNKLGVTTFMVIGTRAHAHTPPGRISLVGDGGGGGEKAHTYPLALALRVRDACCDRLARTSTKNNTSKSHDRIISSRRANVATLSREKVTCVLGCASRLKPAWEFSQERFPKGLMAGLCSDLSLRISRILLEFSGSLLSLPGVSCVCMSCVEGTDSCVGFAGDVGNGGVTAVALALDLGVVICWCSWVISSSTPSI